MPATIASALLDVNVLIASVFEDHAHHRSARHFCDGLLETCTTPTTQGGFLRFATRPRREGVTPLPPRLTMTRALEVLKDIGRMSSHRFLADDASFGELSAARMVGHRQWTDAYLLHLAAKHGIVLATFDEGLTQLAPSRDGRVVLVPSIG